MSIYVKKLVFKAREASYKLANLSTSRKNKALRSMAEAIIKEKDFILKENHKDINQAKKINLKQSLLERLALDDKRLEAMAKSLKEIALLKDPIGEIISDVSRPNRIRIKKVRSAIGVVLIVYEARPNVTSDCVGLLFKTSNVGILRGGSSASYSNKAIGKVLAKSLIKSGINFLPFFIVESLNHNVVDELLKEVDNIDLVIPRGGEALIRKVVKLSQIPVIKHYKGVCHIFVDKTADLKKALKICINAKVQRPSVCNAVETILVHQGIASKFLPLLKEEFNTLKVEIRAGSKAAKIISGTKKANKDDWSTEYLDLVVSLKIVKNIDEAINHINFYGSHHTESILTESKVSADKFTQEVDSACCFVNISTRFSDGHQFGLGAEIGISTDKLHARGPMGLEELTTYKWIAKGNGQIRE